MRVEKDVTVNAPIERVYGMWIDFENFPKFMEHVDSVVKTGEGQYHWKAKIGPFEKEWDADVKGLVENRTVTWCSTSGAENAGAVMLAQRGNVTQMHVVIEYEPTWLEAIGDTIMGTLTHSVEEDLERFKRMAEGHDPDLADVDSDPSEGQAGSSTV
ncbi:MAG: SRPBCC family protein [Chloroflexia bacterium]